MSFESVIIVSYQFEVFRRKKGTILSLCKLLISTEYTFISQK